jgi:hypothetical protein
MLRYNRTAYPFLQASSQALLIASAWCPCMSLNIHILFVSYTCSVFLPYEFYFYISYNCLISQCNHFVFLFKNGIFVSLSAFFHVLLHVSDNLVLHYFNPFIGAQIDPLVLSNMRFWWPSEWSCWLWSAGDWDTESGFQWLLFRVWRSLRLSWISSAAFCMVEAKTYSLRHKTYKNYLDTYIWVLYELVTW